MKLSALLLSASLIIGLNLSAYAQDKSHSSLTSAEKSTLATIAAIDQNEILVGVVAENKNAGSAVNDFAKMMIDQHGDNLTQIFNMEGQFKTGPLTSSEADSLSKEGKKDLAKLGPMQGDEFAKAYADAMVKGHEAALKLINDKLMKTAKNEEIKKFLEDTRSAVESHLEQAKKLQADLKS